jgi:hypothetical protein
MSEPQIIYQGPFGTFGYLDPSAKRFGGWLFTRHPDGQWVSLAKIPGATPSGQPASGEGVGIMTPIKEELHAALLEAHAAGSRASIKAVNDLYDRFSTRTETPSDPTWNEAGIANPDIWDETPSDEAKAKLRETIRSKKEIIRQLNLAIKRKNEWIAVYERIIRKQIAEIKRLSAATPSDEAKAKGWLIYIPGAGSESSKTFTTHLRSIADKWRDEAEVTPLYDRAALSAATPDRVQGSAEVIMPTALTFENGAKHAMIGEFKFYPHSDSEQQVTVPWTTTKEIYAAAVKLLGRPAPSASAAPAVDVRELEKVRDVVLRVKLFNGQMFGEVFPEIIAILNRILASVARDTDGGA